MRKPKLIRKKGSPYWQYDFQLATRRFQGSTNERDHAQAQAVLDKVWREAVALVESLKKSGREPLTIERAAARWWDEVGQHSSEHDLGPFSRDPALSHLPINGLVENLGRGTMLHAIKNDHVARLVALRRKDLVHEGTDENGKAIYRRVSARTVNRTVTKLLRRVMRKAVKSWNAEIHNMPDWSEHVLEEKKNLPRVIRFDEESRLEEVERAELRIAREFATMSSLRLAEVVGLTWFNVDFLAGTITLLQKGGEPRVLAITPTMEALLRPLHGHHETAVFTFVAKRTRRCPKTKREFIKGQRYPLTREGLTSAWRRDWKKAGVDACWHDLRRTAAQRMRDFGSLEDARDLLGHKDIKTTEIYLGGLDVDRQRQAMVRRDRVEAEMRERATAESRKNSRTAASKPVK
jgi:integrase